MGFAFNPFTGNFDAKGSGGGGSSYIDGEVQNFSALPETIGSPAVDSAYLVREAEGTWLLNRKPAGIYIRTANTGTRASDWTYAGEFPDVFNDANFVLYDNGDSTKNLQFQLSGISTGTTRTITVPDANITLDDAGDSRTPTSHASSHASAGSDPLFDQDLNTTDNVEFPQVGFGGDFTIDSVGLNWGGQLIFEPETNTFFDTNGNNAFTVGAACEFFKDITVRQVGDPTARVTLDVASVTTGQNRAISFPDASGTLALTSDIPAIGTGSTEVAAGDHGHGNITSDGKLGSTAGLPLKTGTAGVVEAGAFGTGAGEFAEGNHTHELTALDATGATNGHVLTAQGDGTAAFAAASGVTTGSVDNAVIRADGTGGSTSQSSDLVIDDATTSTQANVALVNNHSETNSALVLAPKGTGAFILGPKPDGTTTGGNARGTNAVDLQYFIRGNANQVASGYRSFIAGGSNNRASGNNSFAASRSNTATAQDSFAAGGAENTASATGACAVGGRINQATSTYGFAIGSKALADRLNIFAQGGHIFSDANAANPQGGAQRISAILGAKTTDGSAVEARIYAVDVSSRLTVPSGKVMAMLVNITGVKSDGSAVAHYVRQYCIKNVGGTTSEVYAPVTIGTDNAAGTSIALSADDTNDALKIEVTGIASETWRWVASVDAVEVIYGS